MTRRPLTIAQITAANRTAWNRSAPFHKDSDNWNELASGFSAGEYSVLDSTLTDILVSLGIAGKSVVQVGCNNGRETLSLKKLGAEKCVGIDHSDAFIAQAMELCSLAKENCSFICADIYDAPEELNATFDYALITIGVLNWMPDLPSFISAVTSLLHSTGVLVIYETHPYLEMFDPHSDAPRSPSISYFKEEPFVETEILVYDGKTHEGGAPYYWHIHTVGDIINACINKGLNIETFQEYPHSIREPDYDIYREQAAQLPMCFSLVARKV